MTLKCMPPEVKIVLDYMSTEEGKTSVDEIVDLHSDHEESGHKDAPSWQRMHQSPPQM